MANEGDGADESESKWPPPIGLKSQRLDIDDRRLLVFGFPLFRTGILSALSRAERDVARLALAGASNAEIARARGSAPRTVANQLGSIFRKLGISSRAELAERLSSVDLDF